MIMAKCAVVYGILFAERARLTNVRRLRTEGDDEKYLRALAHPQRDSFRALSIGFMIHCRMNYSAARRPMPLRTSVWFRRYLQPTSERGFGIGFAVAFSVIGLAPMLTRRADVRWWALASAAVFFVCACFAPWTLRPLRTTWFRLGPLLNRSLSAVIMGALFFLAFVPMGLFLRVIGKDLLRLRGNSSVESYWITRDPPGPARGSMNSP